jgi:spore coat protein CotF
MSNNVILQEKDILTDILTAEKGLVKGYGHYLVEVNCPKMRTLLTNNFKAVAGDQFCVYDAMSKRGYYPSKDALTQDVKQAKTKFAGISEHLTELS